MTTPQASLATIGDGAIALTDALVALRRDLHMHPELSGDERRTAGLVASRLRQLGLEVEEHVGGYGVVGVLQGAHPGPTLAYRADMDALPIQEISDRPYASLSLGVSHACGHDAHVTVALGAAELLAGLRSDLHGRVVFIFQPAEESLDGARVMIEAGLLERYQPAAMLALHVSPLQVGTVGIAEDRCLAGMEEFHVRFYTPGGDLEALVGEAATALQALSTHEGPQDAAQFEALAQQMETGSGLDRAVFVSCWSNLEEQAPAYHLLGLASLTDFDQRPALQCQIRRTLDRVVDRYDATYDLAVTFVNPPLRNASALVAEIRPALERLPGVDRVRLFHDPYPFSHEDLALFAARVPTAFVWLGTANARRGFTSMLHTPDFDIDEDALVIGTQVAAAALLHLSEAWR
ncbi:MAG: amidohydrolase [Anaerolineae bacterium]|nr:amidohydrolase [Anaerolineae bacterium]